jgi:hypothetical protein
MPKLRQCNLLNFKKLQAKMKNARVFNARIDVACVAPQHDLYPRRGDFHFARQLVL